MNFISIILSIITFAVGLVVLVRLFQTEGPLKGVLGLICMLYTYIWGWINAKKLNLTTIMLIWTAVIVVSIVITVIVTMAAVSSQLSSFVITF